MSGYGLLLHLRIIQFIFLWNFLLGMGDFLISITQEKRVHDLEYAICYKGHEAQCRIDAGRDPRDVLIPVQRLVHGIRIGALNDPHLSEGSKEAVRLICASHDSYWGRVERIVNERGKIRFNAPLLPEYDLFRTEKDRYWDLEEWERDLGRTWWCKFSTRLQTYK